MWEIDRKSLDKNEIENLTNFVEVRLFKVFLKLPGGKPSRKAIHYNKEKFQI